MSWGGTRTCWGTGATYPIHYEDLVEFPFLLQLPGGNGHRVEEAEPPAKREVELISTMTP